MAGQEVQPVFAKPEEQKVAQIAYDVIRKLENRPSVVPTLAHLSKPEVSGGNCEGSTGTAPTCTDGAGGGDRADRTWPAVVAKTVALVTQQTRLPGIASRQEQYVEVCVRRIQALPVSGAEV